MKTIFNLVVLFFCINTNAAVVLTDYFHPIGPSENLVAKFDHSVEATTLNLYSGFVLVKYSNFGWDNLDQAYDAFYKFIWNGNSDFSIRFDSKANHIGFNGATVINGGSQWIADNSYEYSIAFNDNIGVCNDYGRIRLNSGNGRNFLPLYNPSHEYEIVLNLITPGSDYPKKINFGFGDLGLSDNRGEYYIQVTPLAIGAIPEPDSVIFTALILLLVIVFRWKKLL